MSVYEPVADASEPEWVARKAKFDSYDDGHGPCLYWAMKEEEEIAQLEDAWKDFKRWAADNLGQGFSLACHEGWFVDQVTAWTYKGFLAGRGIEL